MPSLFYAGQPDYIEKLNTLATAASMTNGTVAASFLSLAVTGTATAASFVGPLTGNASTATALATPRAINGVNFDGTAAITVTAAAGTLTGATLAAGVTASSLTSVGTLTALTVSGTSTLGITRVSGADAGAPQFGVSGATKGIRFVTAAGASGIQGVDNTLTASFQPLVISGSTLTLTSAAADVVDLATNGGASIHLRVAHVASVVNCLQVSGSATGGLVTVTTQGADANIGAYLATKGTGAWRVATGGGDQLRVTNTASAVNYASITGAATGNGVRYGVDGSDANIAWAASSKGTFGLGLYTNNFTNLQFAVSHTASAVNYYSVNGGATGVQPGFAATGSDANVSSAFTTKGTGGHFFSTNTFGATQFVVAHTASAVNYLQATGSTTGNEARLSVQGTDTNAGMWVTTKGTGVIRLETGGGEQVRVSHTAAAVNYLNLTGSATGSAVTISTGGSDTNRSMTLTAAGTGLVQIGNDSLRIVTSKTPASAAATGTQGQIAWDASYIYVCTANNTWKRAALATW